MRHFCGNYPDVPRKQEGRLALLKEDERRTFLSFLVQQISPAKSWAATQDLYPGMYDYNIQSVRHYAKSAQFKEEKAQVLEEMRLVAPQKGFANRRSRLIALNEIAGRILGLLVGLADEEVVKIVRLAEEFRQIMKALREEMDPLGAQDTQTHSNLEMFLKEKYEVLQAEKEKQGIHLPDAN